MSSRGSHVRIDAVSHRYGFRSDLVLKDITLTIEPGERVALVGRSGCGKSTLLQLISGLVRPSQGAIWIDGRKVTEPSPKWNMMFQKPLLYPWMTVERNAAFGMLIAGESELAKKRIPELLDLVGLGAYAKVNSQQLSGGQQQRVALARSLATQPELLMLDEPFAALDEVTRANLQQDVTRITRQFEMTQVIVTHDIDEAITMADRILIMSPNPGRIIGDIANDMPASELKKKIRGYLGGDVDVAKFSKPSTSGVQRVHYGNSEGNGAFQTSVSVRPS